MGKDSIEPFSTKGSQAEVQDQWKKWVRSFEYFLVAEYITDPVRMKMLLMKMLLTDPLPVGSCPHDDDDYKAAIRCLNSRFTYTPNSTFDRHVFRQLRPKPGETCMQFSIRLAEQSKLCNFGAAAEEAIRDQLVETCADRELQSALLSTEKLTLDVALQKFRVHELSHIQVAGLNSHGTPSEPVASVSRDTASAQPSQPPPRQRDQHCPRCNYTWHSESDSRCPRSPAHVASVTRKDTLQLSVGHPPLPSSCTGVSRVLIMSLLLVHKQLRLVP